jgi:Putative peptidoglycan binding domain
MWFNDKMAAEGLLNYTLLHRGDRRPAVGVLQKLLNRNGAGLVPDGVFGHRTEMAVRDFQQRHIRDGLKVDGIVGIRTWPILTERDDLLIVDCVDLFDATGEDKLPEVIIRNLKDVGAKRVDVPGLRNGVDVAMTEILRIVGKRKLFQLRFNGHGRPGSQSVSGGGSRMDGSGSDSIEPGPSTFKLSMLKNAFGPYGCVEFKGCHAASGPKGHELLREVANAIGVPVTAGIQNQIGGSPGQYAFKVNSRMFGFQGPTVTAIPYGGSLHSWCRKLPDFPGSLPGFPSFPRNSQNSFRKGF